MKKVSSAEFRKTYAKLQEPTEVTALGRTAGWWIPVNNAAYVGLAPIGADGHYVPISSAIDDRFVAGQRPGEPPETIATVDETHVWTGSNALDSDDVIRKAWTTSRPAPKTGRGQRDG